MIPSDPGNDVGKENSPAEVSESESRFQAKLLRVAVDSPASSSKIKAMKNWRNPASPKLASPKPASNHLAVKPSRSSMKKNSGVGLHPAMNLNRATCSSAAKAARNVGSSELGEPKPRVCSYKYCSLHNQQQEESLPALKCFLSAKRRSVKAQNSKKLKDQNKNKERRANGGEIADIISGLFDGMKLEDHDEAIQLQESYSVTSFEDYGDKSSEISSDEEIEDFNELFQYVNDGSEEEEEHLEAEKNENGEGETSSSSYLQFSYSELESSKGSLSACKQAEAESKATPEAGEEEFTKGSLGSLEFRVELPNSPEEESLEEEDRNRLEAKCLPNSPEKGKVTNSESLVSENALAELTNRLKANDCTVKRTAVEKQEIAREFKPRPPRFLPMKAESEAEKVILKHQPMDERKAAEEWMIDYALRKTLVRMAPARKRKVSLLVAAFESVIQQERKTTVL